MESVPSFSIAVMSSSSALTPSKVPSSGELARSLLASDSGSLVVALGSRSPWPTLGRKGFILKGKKRGNTSQIAAAGRLAPRHSPAAEADTLSLINSGSLERDCDVTRGGEGPARRLARSQRLNPFHNHLGCLLALTQGARVHEAARLACAGSSRQTERQVRRLADVTARDLLLRLPERPPRGGERAEGDASGIIVLFSVVF